MIGVSESMFVAVFPDPSRSLTYAQAFSLLILMVVLLIRPTGLFGRAHVADGIIGAYTALIGAGVVLRCVGAGVSVPGERLLADGGVLALFYAIVAASWALLAGYAGPVLLRPHGVRILGAYTSGLLVKWFGVPIPLGMVAGVLLCARGRRGIGFICLRMRGPYLALFTVAFSEVLRIVIVSENEVTGGSGGLEVTPLFHARSDAPYYYLGLALLLGSLA